MDTCGPMKTCFVGHVSYYYYSAYDAFGDLDYFDNKVLIDFSFES